MNFRTLGKTGFDISEISLGTWQVGGKWGSGFDHDLADKILREGLDQGINFIDTADVYEAGRERDCCRKDAKEYTRAHLRRYQVWASNPATRR